MSWEIKSNWEVLAAITSVVILGLYVTVEMVAPMWRRRKLKTPCNASFHIRELQKRVLDYAMQDDTAHNVMELVLPSNSLVEIEVSYYPIINFHVDETAFGCEGDFDSKPVIEEPIAPFVAKGELPLAPGYWDRQGYYHYFSRSPGRSVGSCYTKGFKLRTKKAGVYRVMLGFLTDEIDGSAYLQIRVEDKPSTRMRCVEHWGCYVNPINKP